MTPTKQDLRRALLRTPALASLITAALCLAAPARGGDPDAVDPRLQPIEAVIESTFLRGDPAALRPELPRRIKVYVSAPALGIDGAYYGPDQTLLLLRRLLDERSTLRFTFSGTPARPQEDRESIVAARWRFRDRGGSESDVRISFTLAPEESGWSIREIRELK